MAAGVAVGEMTVVSCTSTSRGSGGGSPGTHRLRGMSVAMAVAAVVAPMTVVVHKSVAVPVTTVQRTTLLFDHGQPLLFLLPC